MAKFFKTVLSTLDSLSGPSVAGLGMLLLVGVGLVDYGTGVDVSMAAFYAVPVFLFAWRFGPAPGVGMALLCGFVQFLSNVTWTHGDGLPRLVLWNVLMDLSASLLLVAVVWALRNSLAASLVIDRTDSVTGLANARNFLERAEIEFERSRLDGHPLALGLLDVGATSDELAADPAGVVGIVAGILHDRTRNVDLCARLDSGVFGVLLAGLDLPQAGEAFGDFRDRIAAELPGPAVLLVGAVVLRRPARRVDEMLRYVDRMLPRASRPGERFFQVASFPATGHD